MIRPAEEADFPIIQNLLEQLGCPQNLTEVKNKFHTIKSQKDHALLVAEESGAVVGMMHLFIRHAIEKSPCVIIQSIVVDESQRGKGYGKIFMLEAENWAKYRRCEEIRLNSAHSREESHAFYKAFGYENLGLTFKKDLTE